MAHALIVDDDPDVVEWLQEVARMEGFTMSAVWHERTHGDLAHRWLRGVVEEEASKS